MHSFNFTFCNGGAWEQGYTFSSCVFLCSQIHEQRLKAKGYYADVEIRRAVREVHAYKKLHQDKPGFFDTAINTGTPLL